CENRLRDGNNRVTVDFVEQNDGQLHLKGRPAPACPERSFDLDPGAWIMLDKPPHRTLRRHRARCGRAVRYWRTVRLQRGGCQRTAAGTWRRPAALVVQSCGVVTVAYSY